ncbi:hypothetical protein Dimus_008784 [Dionaea muscipula]
MKVARGRTSMAGKRRSAFAATGYELLTELNQRVFHHEALKSLWKGGSERDDGFRGFSRLALSRVTWLPCAVPRTVSGSRVEFVSLAFVLSFRDRYRKPWAWSWVRGTQRASMPMAWCQPSSRLMQQMMSAVEIEMMMVVMLCPSFAGCRRWWMDSLIMAKEAAGWCYTWRDHVNFVLRFIDDEMLDS